MKIGTSTVTAIYLGTTSIVSAYLGATQVFGGASAFTPLDLFSGGAQGIWLDPSDLTTMFSDRAGTTPVTAPGTVVGLRLDKSKGLTLGSELVTNGTFDTDVANWLQLGVASLAWSDGKAYVARAGTAAGAYQEMSVAANKTYLVTGDLSGVVGSRSLNVFVAGGVTTELGGQLKTASGAFSFVFNSGANTSVRLYMGGASSSSGLYDNISVRELPGNHAQAPTDAARPIYGVEPKGGRRNLLTFSEDLTNAAWVKIGSTVPSTQYLAPDGTTTADLLLPDTASSQHYMNAPSPTSVLGAHVISYYVKANGANFVQIAFGSSSNPNNARINYDLAGKVVGTTSAGLTGSIVELPGGDGWFRIACVVDIDFSPVSHSVALISSATDARLPVFTGDGTSGILIWGAQLELGSTVTPYQRVTIAEDVTEAGVPTCHYCRYDGINNSMSTSAIDFTATDKMSVFAGVRKNVDSPVGMIAELSANASLSGAVGSFFFVAGTDAGSVYSSLSRGSAAAAAGQTTYTTAGAAPDAAALTATHDIAGALSTIRRNGAAGTNGTASKGTGNFGNYPLFIGRRNNASLPFNGRDYGIIVVGKLASAGEITDTETWLAAKTSGVVLP